MPDRRGPTDRRRDSDRRAAQRHSCEADIRFLRSSSSPVEILQGELIDVSTTGLRLLLRDEVAVGERLLIEVRDPEHGCFNLTAAVVWTEVDDAGEPMVGCELCVDLSPRQYVRLRQLATTRLVP